MKSKLHTPLAAKRTCLRCGKQFPSTGPGNRICSHCKVINARIEMPPRAMQVTRLRGT